jgi:hypothetical protein
VSRSGVQWFAGLRSRLASGKPLRACELRPPARAGQLSCSSASSAAPSSTATPERVGGPIHEGGDTEPLSTSGDTTRSRRVAGCRGPTPGGR